MGKSVQLVVVGVGLIGKRHITAIEQCSSVALLAVVDPNPEIKLFAKELGVRYYSSVANMFSNETPDGIILATPNQLHVEVTLESIKKKCPVLIEKPITTTSKEAKVLVEASYKSKIPLLVGHHRRHNPLIQKAREIIDTGKLGVLRAVHINCWLYKPDEYFEEVPWRKQKGAGPLSVNLVHDIDIMQYLCGDVQSVQAQQTPSIRGYENEDVAVAILKFKNGALGTLTVSDMILAPWSWELTARENPAYPPTSESCYLLGGSKRSLSLPNLTLWENHNKRSWWEPLSAVTIPRNFSDPLVNQINQFAAVINGVESPLVSGEDGMKALRIIEAIYDSAKSGELINLD